MSTSETTGQDLPPVPRVPKPHYCGQLTVPGGPKRAVFAVPTVRNDRSSSAWVTSWGEYLRQAGGLS